MGINRASGSKCIGMLTGANRLHIAATLLASLALFPVAPAIAIDGEILITHAKALAGNVTPGDPAGYPVIISLPGSFKLASNLFVPANKIGIQVTSTNVTIDLNGFTMQGSGVAWYGITGGVDGVTVKNGTITRFKFDGINGGLADFWTIENMQIRFNLRYGINLSLVASHYASIRNSVIVGNLGGIVAGDSFLLEGSVVGSNGGDGIWCYQACLVNGNNISFNAAIGVRMEGAGSVVNNTIVNNTGYGIRGGSTTGSGNNTLRGNNGGGAQVVAVSPLDPNACFPACP